jgi:hypothetical protein
LRDATFGLARLALTISRHLETSALEIVRNWISSEQFSQRQDAQERIWIGKWNRMPKRMQRKVDHMILVAALLEISAGALPPEIS